MILLLPPGLNKSIGTFKVEVKPELGKEKIRHLLAEERTIHGTLQIFFKNKTFLFVVKIES